MAIAEQLNEKERAILDQHPAIEIMTADSLYPGSDADLPLLRVRNQHSAGVIALQGAQVLSFVPDKQRDLLWVSPLARLRHGANTRGGIPVCLPWFGVKPGEPGKPRHGFARTCRWHLHRAESSARGVTTLTLVLEQFKTTPHEYFAHPFEATLEMTFGSALELRLGVTNCSTEPMPLSWALHSYHPVDELSQASVTGLQGTEYLDNTRGLERATQQGDPRFEGEFDRVYLDTGASQTITGSPAIRVSAVNAPTTVLWNPGAALAAGIADLGVDGHRHFICLERGAAFDDEQVLPPATTLQALVTIAAASR